METDRRGFVPVDEKMQVLDTKGKPVPHLYCIGDANGMPFFLCLNPGGCDYKNFACKLEHMWMQVKACLTVVCAHAGYTAGF